MKGPIYVNGTEELNLGSCYRCKTRGNGNFEIDSNETEYVNYQKLTIQETPGSVPAGRVPR